MVGTSRAVTNDSIDEESKDVYRHEEKLEAILVLDSCFQTLLQKICLFLITMRRHRFLSRFFLWMRRERFF